MFSLTEHSFDILYLLTLGYTFQFSRNHHQALSKKYKDPLHRTIKMRFGIPNVHNKHLVMIHMYHIGSHFRPTIPNSWGAYPEKIPILVETFMSRPQPYCPPCLFWVLPHLRQNPHFYFFVFCHICGKIQKFFCFLPHFAAKYKKFTRGLLPFLGSTAPQLPPFLVFWARGLCPLLRQNDMYHNHMFIVNVWDPKTRFNSFM